MTAPGANGNKCWGRVTVEDKMAPVMTCDTIAIYCNMAFHPDSLCSYPTATDNCDTSVTFTYADLPPENFSSCGGNPADADTIKLIRRTWVAIDDSNNRDTCEQLIYVLKPTLQQVKFPDSIYGALSLIHI